MLGEIGICWCLKTISLFYITFIMPHFTVRKHYLLHVFFILVGYGELGPHRPLARRGYPAFEEHAQRRGLRVREHLRGGDADQPLPWEHRGLLGENEAFMGGMRVGRLTSHAFLTPT